MAFFTGYLAQGIGSSTAFTEATASGYARVPVSMNTLVNGATSLSSAVSYFSGSSYTVTQRALYDAPTGGNLIMWWNLANHVAVTASAGDAVKAGALMHTFSDLYRNGLGSPPFEYAATSQIGTTSDGNPIWAGVALEVAFGTIYAATHAGRSLAGAAGNSSNATTPVTTIGASGASQTISFPASGNAVYDITLSANCTITLSGGTAGQYQLLTLILRQPASGSAYTVTLPPEYNGTSGVRYSGGAAPAVSTTLGQDTVINYSTPDGGTTYFGGL